MGERPIETKAGPFRETDLQKLHNGTRFSSIKRAIFGNPIHSSRAHHERLSPFLALPVFASDALSSVAYATEAIVSVLILYSVGALGSQIAITLGICTLIVIVSASYKQTIDAYPSGGGSYIVASENLGETPGLLAGAALLIDYVLTVSVSVSAGVAALISAYPNLHQYLVPMSLMFIGIVAWAILRGVKESGLAFAFPTYGFLLGMFAMLIFGAIKAAGAGHVAQTVIAEPGMIGKDLTLPFIFVFLRAFAAGCTALTGVEAVSNGVPAFRAPESRNASRTLVTMAGILVLLFVGTGLLMNFMPRLEVFATTNPQYRTLVSQIAAYAFGGVHAPMYFYIQFATAAILILAANTSFADFPRLASLLARDGYLPRTLARQGDRLVFQNGIVLLAIASSALIWHFHGQLDQLLPLYAVGVFMAFTLSQAGMVMHWIRLKGKGWQRLIAVNAIGSIITGVVTLVILITKFTEGAWIVTVLLAILFVIFRWISARYKAIGSQLAPLPDSLQREGKHTVLLLVPRVHRGILSALNYAKSLHTEVRAIHVSIDPASIRSIKEAWSIYGGEIPLMILNSPYRSLIQPILDYVDAAHDEEPDRVVTVIIAEAVPRKWVHKLLQENVALQLKMSLGRRNNVIVTNVRYFLD